MEEFFFIKENFDRKPGKKIRREFVLPLNKIFCALNRKTFDYLNY
jgi:hypothetical protein